MRIFSLNFPEQLHRSFFGLLNSGGFCPSVSSSRSGFFARILILSLCVGSLVNGGVAFAQATDDFKSSSDSAESAQSSQTSSKSEPTSQQLPPVLIRSGVAKQGRALGILKRQSIEANRDTVKSKVSSDLSDVLDSEPNMAFVGGPRGFSELPQIRGLGSERIIVLDEGVRQNFQSGHSGRLFADMSSLEQVEVLKGPWSALYGSGAIGGVISLRRSLALDYVRRTGRTQGFELASDLGSANNEVGARVTGFSQVGQWAPLVSYRAANAGNTRLGGGTTLPYSAQATQDLFGSLQWASSERQSIDLKVNSFRLAGESPLNPSLESTSATQVADMTTEKRDVIIDFRRAQGPYQFHALPYIRRTEVVNARLSDRRTDRQTVETRGLDTWVTRTWDQESGESHLTPVPYEFTVGLEGFEDVNAGDRGGVKLGSFPNGRSRQFGVYAQSSLPVTERLILTPGFRFDRFENEDESQGNKSNSGQRSSAKLHTMYRLNENSEVFAGFGQAFNAPTIQDLYVSGLHFPGNFFQPNADLKPEVATSVEAGFASDIETSSESRVRLKGSIFGTDAEDFINRNVSGSTTKFENIGRVRLYGTEWSADFQWTSWQALLTYGLVRSENRIDSAPLADTPADRISTRLNWFPTEALVIGTDLTWFQRQDRVPSGTNPTGEAFLQSLVAEWRSGDWEAQFRIDNLWDRSFKRHASNVNEVGRDIKGQVSYLF